MFVPVLGSAEAPRFSTVFVAMIVVNSDIEPPHSPFSPPFQNGKMHFDFSEIFCPILGVLGLGDEDIGGIVTRN